MLAGRSCRVLVRSRGSAATAALRSARTSTSSREDADCRPVNPVRAAKLDRRGAWSPTSPRRPGLRLRQPARTSTSAGRRAGPSSADRGRGQPACRWSSERLTAGVAPRIFGDDVSRRGRTAPASRGLRATSTRHAPCARDAGGARRGPARSGRCHGADGATSAGARALRTATMVGRSIRERHGATATRHWAEPAVAARVRSLAATPRRSVSRRRGPHAPGPRLAGPGVDTGGRDMVRASAPLGGAGAAARRHRAVPARCRGVRRASPERSRGRPCRIAVPGGRVPLVKTWLDCLAGVPAAHRLRSAGPRQGRAQQGDRGGGVAHRHRRPRRQERLPLLRRRLRAERLREGREDRPDRGRPGLADQPRPAVPQGQREQVAGHQPDPGHEGPVPPSVRDGVGGPRPRHGDGDDRRPRARRPPQELAGVGRAASASTAPWG